LCFPSPRPRPKPHKGRIKSPFPGKPSRGGRFALKNWKSYLPFCLAGAAAGLINGFFGAGGGMVLVPLLIHLGKLPDKEAFASSIAIILPLCLVALFVYCASGSLPLADAWACRLRGLGGGLLGS